MNRATVVGQVRLNNSNRKRGGAALSRAKMALSAAAISRLVTCGEPDPEALERYRRIGIAVETL